MAYKTVTIKLPQRSGLFEVFEISTSQDMTLWQAQGYLFKESAPTVAVATLTTTLDATAKTITVTIAPLSDTIYTENERLGFRLLVDPNLGYAIEFVAGLVDLNTGGPAWV